MIPPTPHPGGLAPMAQAGAPLPVVQILLQIGGLRTASFARGAPPLPVPASLG